jgi:hypothetical protein
MSHSIYAFESGIDKSWGGPRWGHHDGTKNYYFPVLDRINNGADDAVLVAGPFRCPSPEVAFPTYK